MSVYIINLVKSLFYLHESILIRVCNRIKKITCIIQGLFPFVYGLPYFYGGKNKNHFEELIKKVMKRLSLWRHKLLSFGGRYIFITHVLQSMPVYMLSSMNPYASMIN